jgi:uncharacterized repeat protein (TIGR01451 family)
MEGQRLNPRAGRGWRRVLAGVALVAAAVLLIAQPAGAQFRSGVGRLWDPNIASGLAYDAQIFRVLHNIPAGRNVAVFRYQLPNGEVRTLAIDSARYTRGGGKHRGEGHSEERLDLILERWGIDPEWVTEIYSELEPCTLPGHNCKGMIKQTFPNLRGVYHSLDYPYEHGGDDAQKRANQQVRARSVATLKREAEDLMRRNVIRPGGGTRLPVLSPHFMPKFPGGIDFTSLELRYVSDTRKGGLRYSLRGRPSAGAGDPAVALNSAGQASDAFFAWLTLPPQSFWVNLNPSEPNRIVDPALARSDAGRVLLEADLQLKRDVVDLMNPDTAIGDRFWDELEAIYGNRKQYACMSSRVWIVPEPATVRETGDELYILDAPLTVKVQSMLINNPDTGTPGCPREAPAVEARKEDLVRRVILPSVIKTVNSAPSYAALRRVYFSRVAAEWFRQRNAGKRTAVSPFVDSGKIDRWATRTPWDPKEVFGRYLDSLRHGEWTTKRQVEVGGQVYERTLIYGGVDFSQTPKRPVSRTEFKTRWPKVAERVRRSQNGPSGDGSEIWLGGGDQRSAAIKRVRLAIRAPKGRVHAGERVTYRIAVSNPTARALRGVTVCDRLPSELGFVRSSLRRNLRNGWHCWQVPRIGAGATKAIRLTTHVRNGARGRAVTRATASVPDSAEGAMAQRAVRVAGAQAGRPGGVTG